MTDKYLDFENKAFGTSKTKDDSDVTIEDIGATNFTPNINNVNPLRNDGGKNKAIVNSAYAILSKGMRERIARKIKNNEDYSQGLINENQEFINFSLVKPKRYPEGLGLNNPLIMQNKRYDILRYENPNPNPQPFRRPSDNFLIKSSKVYQPVLHDVVMLDNKLDDTGFLNQPLQPENPSQFNKSRLFNPEYSLEQLNKNRKPNKTMNDEIRSGPYVGIDNNQYYQYANVQKNYNDKLNNYPDTNRTLFIKPLRK